MRPKQIALISGGLALVGVALVYGCSSEPPPVLATTPRDGLPPGTLGALDVDTPRTLDYTFTQVVDGETYVADLPITFGQGSVSLSLAEVWDIDIEVSYAVDSRGYVTSPSASPTPNVLMLYDAMPGAEIAIGSIWETRQPTDAEAATADAFVLQGLREHTVVGSYDSPEGTLVRVEVEGFYRWVHNAYSEQMAGSDGLDDTWMPDHFGYVDVNIDTGTVVDFIYYGGFGLPVTSPQEIAGHPEAKVLRLCPTAGFGAMADVCGEEGAAS